MIHRPFRIRRVITTPAACIAPVILLSAPAWAAGSNMPWEQPLNQILQSVEGPVAKIMAVIIIIVTGLTLAVATDQPSPTSRRPRSIGQ